jgi:hypothetical protein
MAENVTVTDSPGESALPEVVAFNRTPSGLEWSGAADQDLPAGAAVIAMSATPEKLGSSWLSILAEPRGRLLCGLFVKVATNVDRSPTATHDGASRSTEYLRTENVADALPATAANVPIMTNTATASARTRRAGVSGVRDIVR